MHDLEGVTHHVVCLGECAEGGQDLVVNALRQQHLIKRVLESVSCLVLLRFIIRVVDVS